MWLPHKLGDLSSIPGTHKGVKREKPYSMRGSIKACLKTAVAVHTSTQEAETSRSLAQVQPGLDGPGYPKIVRPYLKIKQNAWLGCRIRSIHTCEYTNVNILSLVKV